MPLYEYECEDHGRFEVLFKRQPKRAMNARKCPQCGARSPLVWPKTVMRPDTYWAGHVHRNYGYVTSDSQIKAIMKEKNHEPVGDRTDREAWEKIAENAQKDKKEKLRKDVRGWSERTFGPSGLGLGGADGEKFIKEHSK